MKRKSLVGWTCKGWGLFNIKPTDKKWKEFNRVAHNDIWLLKRDRKSTRLNSSHIPLSRMPSSA